MGKLICVHTVFHNRSDMTATNEGRTMAQTISHREDLGSIPCHSMWYLCLTDGHWERFSDRVLSVLPCKYNSIDAP